jgi:hypothetical protein
MSFGLQAVSRLRFPDDLNPKRPKDKQETIVLARPMFPCLSFASLISSSSVLRSSLRVLWPHSLSHQTFLRFAHYVHKPARLWYPSTSFQAEACGHFTS